MNAVSDPITLLQLANPVPAGSLREVAAKRADDLLARLHADEVPAPRLTVQPHRRMPLRRALIAAAVLLLLGVGSAIAAHTLTSKDGAPVQFAPTTGSTPSLGSDAASIIATIKARVPDVLSIRITKDAITNASGKGTTNYRIAHVDIAAPADRGPEIARASWESDLIGGALFTAFTQAHLAPPFGVDLTVVSNGKPDQVGGGLGKVVPNQVFAPVTPEIQSRIQQNATAEGLTNVRVSTFQVVNDVIEIRATTRAAPAAAASSFYKAHGLDGLLGQPENDFEGVYFQLDDTKGNPILIQTTAPRAGAGGYWAAPSTGIQGDHLKVPRHEGPYNAPRDVPSSSGG